MTAPIAPDEIADAPWQRYNHDGAFTSTDGCDTTDFKKEDVAVVIAYGETARRDWDGKLAAIVKLNDGRYVSWESWWGPTGSGFCCDAYGGDAEVIFSHTLEAATRAITESAREMLVWFEARP